MEIRYLNQPKEIKLGEVLKQRLSEDFDNVWIVAGMAKDNAFDIIFNPVKEAIENGTKVNIALGIDSKTISKDILLKLINAKCNVRVHSNTEENKFETRVYVFEKQGKEKYVYLSSSKLSEGGLAECTCLVTEIKYNAGDEDEFNSFIQSLLIIISSSDFKDVTADYVKELVNNGEVMARITERKIPRISDVYNKNEFSGMMDYDESSSSMNVAHDYEDVDIAIDTLDDTKK